MIDARRRGWKLGAVLLALFFAFVATEVFARGGGRGGGGGGRGGGGFGGGGGGYGGRSVSRSSPAAGGLGTMQRSRSPDRGYSSTTRPSTRDYGAGTRDYGANRPATGRPVAPSTQPGGGAGSNRPGAPSTRPGAGDGGLRGDTAGDRQQQRQDAASDRMEKRDTNRDDAREDWQNHLDDAREDRQDYWENYDWDEVHVHDDDEFDWHSGTWIVITTGTAITYSAFDTMRAQPACNFFQTEVNGTVYYRCGSTWYIEAVTAGEVRYVAVEPPQGY